ncbi:hypothetical protein BLNAU_14416 [Blattamonas nauphoetae]|uniref:Uncharacterized protein n=1 Tax=Blattamonas nauphoetae TaxID=2049346 RepID=A0ABQ9XHB8_9EUKA|nr:hypothetical protein BLNAU_14416 [Blattamonas nauphoetae]
MDASNSIITINTLPSRDLMNCVILPLSMLPPLMTAPPSPRPTDDLTKADNVIAPQWATQKFKNKATRVVTLHRRTLGSILLCRGTTSSKIPTPCPVFTNKQVIQAHSKQIKHNVGIGSLESPFLAFTSNEIN